MKRSLRRMLRPAEKKAPPGVAYRGVEDGVHDSRDSFQVPGRQRPGRRGPGGGGVVASVFVCCGLGTNFEELHGGEGA